MKASGKLRFWWMVAAVLFLWNPIVGMRDYLPDCLGYFCLVIGLSRLSDLNDTLGESQGHFRTMLWISLGQLAAEYLIYEYLSPQEKILNRYETPGWILLFSFLFFALECWFLIQAYRTLFKGLQSLAERHGSTLLKQDRKGRTVFERMARFSTVFVVVRGILSVIPEATTLTSYEHEVEKTTVDLYNHLTAIRALCLIPAILLAIIWVIRWVRFFVRLQKDTDLQNTLWQEYETRVLPDTGLLLNRRVGYAFLLFRVGIACTIGLTLQGREFLPDYAAVLFFGIGILLLRDIFRPKWQFFAGGIVALAVAVAQTIYGRMYFDRYTLTDAHYYEEAYDRLLRLRLISIAEIGCTLICVFGLLWLFYRMIRTHLPVDYGADARNLSEEATRKKLREYRRKLLWIGLSATLMASGRIANLFLEETFSWFWWIPLVLAGVTALLFSILIDDLAEQFRNQYPAKQGI